MKNSKRILSPLFLTAFTVSALAQTPSSKSVDKPPLPETSGESVSLKPALPPMIIIAPTELRAEPTLARGCWVRLFPQTSYKGENDLTIAGPIDIPSLHAPAGNLYWKQKTESLMVGPNATVTVFESPSFQGPHVALQPSSRQPQLRRQLKLMQSIDSLRITCGQP